MAFCPFSDVANSLLTGHKSAVALLTGGTSPSAAHNGGGHQSFYLPVRWGMIRLSGTVSFLGLALQPVFVSTFDVGSRRLL